MTSTRMIARRRLFSAHDQCMVDPGQIFTYEGDGLPAPEIAEVYRDQAYNGSISAIKSRVAEILAETNEIMAGMVMRRRPWHVRWHAWLSRKLGLPADGQSHALRALQWATS